VTRHIFGQGPSDWTFTVGTANAATLAGGVTITFWDLPASGTQYTNLLDANGTAITSVTSANGTTALPVGTIPLFYGPDTVTEMWADAGGGYRSLVLAHDGFASADDPRFGQISGVTVSGSPAVGRSLAATSGSTAAWMDTFGSGDWVFNVVAYGAKGDAKLVTDGAINVSTSATTLTCATSAPFTAGDVGKSIMIKGAAATGVTTHVTTISSVTDSSHVVLAAGATTTVTGALVVWGTDDTAAIQAATDAAMAHIAAGNSKAKVFFPPRPYVVAGALSTADSGNAQIHFGPISVSNAKGKAVLSFEGASDGAAAVQHWLQPVPQFSGSCLISFGVWTSISGQSSNTAAHGHGAVIGGPNQGSTYGQSVSGTANFSNMLGIVRNLTILQPYSSFGLAYTAVDLSGCANSMIENFGCQTMGIVLDPSTDFDSPSSFANGYSVAVLMSANGNNDLVIARNVSIGGGYTFGFFATEHCVTDRIMILYCWSALVVVGTYLGSVGSTHGITINQASIEACVNILYVMGTGSGGIGPFVKAVIDTETSTPLFADGPTAGAGLATVRGTIDLMGLYTRSGIGTVGGYPLGLKVRDWQQPYPVVTVTSTYTVSIVDDTILANATSGGFAVNLISAATTPNAYTFRNIGTANNVTITPSGTQKINGASTLVLTPGQTARLIPSGGNWYTV
jgi:hypothetical protein